MLETSQATPKQYNVLAPLHWMCVASVTSLRGRRTPTAPGGRPHAQEISQQRRGIITKLSSAKIFKKALQV